MNSLAYGKPTENTISLILFADGSGFRKSSSAAFWVISLIAELPPSLRSSYKNMINHFLFSSSKPSLQALFENNCDDFLRILKNGIFVNGEFFKIRVLGLIGDSPARSKLTFTKQFNGIFGCLHCLHPEEKWKK